MNAMTEDEIKAHLTESPTFRRSNSLLADIDGIYVEK